MRDDASRRPHVHRMECFRYQNAKSDDLQPPLDFGTSGG